MQHGRHQAVTAQHGGGLTWQAASTSIGLKMGGSGYLRRYTCHPSLSLLSLRINFIRCHGIGLRSHALVVYSEPAGLAIGYFKELGKLGLEEIALEHDGLCKTRRKSCKVPKVGRVMNNVRIGILIERNQSIKEP